MPRLTQEQWEEARALRESGVSLSEVAARIGVDRAAVSRRAKREEWDDGSDVAETVRRKVTEKVTGVVTGVDPKRKAEAIDAAAEKASRIIERHKEDWEKHHAFFTVSAIAAEFDLGKSAKISAEMLAIRQKAERTAWGLDDNASEAEVKISWSGTE